MGPTPPRRLSPDTAFRLVADARRRYVLAILVDANRPLDDRQLARRVSARCEETDPDSLSDEQVDRTLVSLRHIHLPKLDDAGAVTYDERTGRVELGDASDDLRPLLRYADAGDL